MAVFNLSGNQGAFAFGLADWHFIIELAERFGWQPAGTVFNGDEPSQFPPRGTTEWSRVEYDEQLLGDYFSNSGQLVGQRQFCHKLLLELAFRQK